MTTSRVFFTMRWAEPGLLFRSIVTNLDEMVSDRLFAIGDSARFNLIAGNYFGHDSLHVTRVCGNCFAIPYRHSFKHWIGPYHEARQAILR